LQSLDGPQASIFGVVDEAVRNAHSAPRTETLRIDVEMLETSDGWRVASVNILAVAGRAARSDSPFRRCSAGPRAPGPVAAAIAPLPSEEDARVMLGEPSEC
jgi:hypothetical protein